MSTRPAVDLRIKLDVLPANASLEIDWNGFRGAAEPAATFRVRPVQHTGEEFPIVGPWSIHRVGDALVWQQLWNTHGEGEGK